MDSLRRNTNSILDDIGQALGMGAVFDRRVRITLRIGNLHRWKC